MMVASLLKPWTVCYLKPGIEPAFRLFCFPYAGGGASVFRDWPDHFPKSVEVCAIQLPGRETRLNEPVFTRLHPLVQELAQALLPLLDRPFAFFGYSVGALVAFELTRHLRAQYRMRPAHLWAAACPAPQVPDADAPIHTLPERDFRDRLRRFNGTPTDVLEHEELMAMVGPILRADFALRETYTYVADAPLDCSITAIGGMQDREVGEAALLAWQEQTSRSFRLRMLPGNHFFLHSSQAGLLQAVYAGLRLHAGGGE
jgi:medium-chain acyl-[acyl-carrier-protein] hydrolase